jgi:UDP-N-acetylglucosamine 2-epimerase (non-hydrolysing)
MTDAVADRPMVMCVVGARPNFVKVAPVLRALHASGKFRPVLVHTGQHYDASMSEVFFRDLDIGDEPVNLGVGSGTHAVQTGAVMRALESLVAESPPAMMLTFGDVNSAMAAALVAAKGRIPQAHVEAGLRSGDPTMPEEVNRVVTDRLADLLFTHSDEADDNLLREGVNRARIHKVGNVMIDSLVRLRPRWQGASVGALGDVPARYGVVTLHRPSNVDEPNRLGRVLESLIEVATDIPLIFPVHPRTQERLASPSVPGVRLVEPMAYLAFLDLVEHAAVVLTDSGGIQEETTALGVPCITLRESTERPVTVRLGTNRLVGEDLKELVPAVRTALSSTRAVPTVPLWDGKAAERIVHVLELRIADPLEPRLADTGRRRRKSGEGS